MAANKVSEEVAYSTLREQAMNNRTTIEEIAESVIRANNMLNLLPSN